MIKAAAVDVDRTIAAAPSLTGEEVAAITDSRTETTDTVAGAAEGACTGQTAHAAPSPPGTTWTTAAGSPTALSSLATAEGTT